MTYQNNDNILAADRPPGYTIAAPGLESAVSSADRGKAEADLIFIDLVDNVEKIGDHLSNIAQAVIGGLQWAEFEPKATLGGDNYRIPLEHSEMAGKAFAGTGAIVSADSLWLSVPADTADATTCSVVQHLRVSMRPINFQF
jgi:hypothetical protein